MSLIGFLLFYRFARRALGIALFTASEASKRRGTRGKRSTGYSAKNLLDDVKKDLGDEKFSDFLALQGEVTLMFALDVTGSMGDEIKASKDIVKEISNYDRSEPVDYILTTFSDPIGRLNNLNFLVVFAFLDFPIVSIYLCYKSTR